MKIAYIFHGTGGHPGENWFPWLKKELEQLNYEVIVPQFPTPENQTLETWFEAFDKIKKGYDEETILIGHSLGGSFLLRLLEKYNINIAASFLVATPVNVLPIKFATGDLPFTGHPFEWEKIKKHCTAFQAYHSDNDPYVSLGNGKEICENLGIDLTFIPNAGHFNAAAGYKEFPKLLDDIKKLLAKDL